MIQFLSLLVLHVLCLFYLRMLWKEKDAALKRGSILTKMLYVSRTKSPRLFYISVWIDLILLIVLYAVLIA